MFLKFIQPGTEMEIYNGRTGEACKGKFCEGDAETEFLIQSEALSSRFHDFARESSLKVSFFRDVSMYTFTAQAKQLAAGSGEPMVRMEQLTGILEYSRRQFDRFEISTPARLFGYTEDSVRFQKAEEDPVFACETFDISTGGLCLVSNRRLSSVYEPFFLVEFILNQNDHFLLPVRLVRKSDVPQSTLYKYEYGFAFLHERVPDEMKRLVNALFKTRLANR